MIEYFKATIDDLDLLMKSRFEMLKVVNELADDYEFSKELTDSTEEFFKHTDQTTILVRDKEIIGCATICYIDVMPTFSHPTGKRSHLMNVYVNDNYRRQGIASKMIDILVEEAKARGVTEISLDATDSGRPLYENYGFGPSPECMIMKLN